MHGEGPRDHCRGTVGAGRTRGGSLQPPLLAAGTSADYTLLCGGRLGLRVLTSGGMTGLHGTIAHVTERLLRNCEI